MPADLSNSLPAFKRHIKQRIQDFDAREWLLALSAPSEPQTGLSARQHYHRLKASKFVEPYLYTGDRKSALFKFYLRARNFGLNARTQHGLPGPATLARKACPFCPSKPMEDEEHFLLVCPAYALARQLMWLNIEGNLLQETLRSEWLDISLSPPRLQLDFLLGATKPSWHSQASLKIDRFVRQFILSAAAHHKSTTRPRLPPPPQYVASNFLLCVLIRLAAC